MTLPNTYETLIEQGIENDYSMGYADICGYRAGTARKHLWFNVLTNQKTKLKIHPFAYMDGTLNEYLGMSPESAQEKIVELFMEAKNMVEILSSYGITTPLTTMDIGWVGLKFWNSP